MRTRSGYVQSISANSVSGVSSGLQWYNNTKSFFNLLGSILYANMDCLVGNFRYLHDDSDELKQPNITDQSNQSNESELGDKQVNGACGICNGTRPNCYCTYPIDNRSAKYLNDSIEQHDELYRKLSGTKYYDDVGYR
jgi:hypothetical protein